MRKTQIRMNKPVYLGLSILDMSKAIMYWLWCDCVKPKYTKKIKHIDTDNSIVYIKPNDIYKHIAEDL